MPPVEVGPTLFISLPSPCPLFLSLPRKVRKDVCLARWHSRKRIAPWRARPRGHHRHSILMGFWIGENSCKPVTPEPGTDQSVSSIAVVGSPLAKTTLLVAALSIFTVISRPLTVGDDFCQIEGACCICRRPCPGCLRLAATLLQTTAS